MDSNTQIDPNISNEEISVKELIYKILEWFKYLYSKWTIILCFILIGGIIGYGYASLKKTAYQATCTFVLEDGEAGGGLGRYSSLASIVGVDMGANGGGGIFQGDNIIELYKSRAMIQKALLSPIDNDGKKKLIDLYINFNNLREKWKKKDPKLADISFETNPTSFTRLQDSVLGATVKDVNKNYLSVSRPDKKLSLIRVDVKSNNEIFSKRFNDQIVKNVNDFYLQTKTKKSLENVSILKQKVDSINGVMNGAINSTAAIADATPNLNPTRLAQRIAPMQKSQFTAEMNKSILAELVKNLELSRITLRRETPLIQIVDEPTYPIEKEIASNFKYSIIGAIIASLLGCLILIVIKVFKNIMQ